jgi:hypothetical protein
MELRNVPEKREPWIVRTSARWNLRIDRAKIGRWWDRLYGRKDGIHRIQLAARREDSAIRASRWAVRGIPALNRDSTYPGFRVPRGTPSDGQRG